MLRALQVEFYTVLAALRDSQRFSVVEFAKYVNKTRESVSSNLHQLVVKQSGGTQHRLGLIPAGPEGSWP